ncbi:MAG TPA: 50S ribosomal protein L11 methyltransferase [Pyrinomonadaceae bacterium]|nr:50S ribosomal protein L11 methyltransferase [Pyrinomonadaceae bacterium]
MKKWFSVEVNADNVAANVIEEFLAAFDGCIGTACSTLGNNQPDIIKITAYFEEKPNLDGLQSSLKDSLEISGITYENFELMADEVSETDWLAKWKEYWKPQVIGPFYIAAPWHENAPQDKIEIKIEPGMAFGTGGHATTTLCIEQIGELGKECHSIADIGTGTGILAIAANKINQSAKILACDVDLNSCRIAATNFEKCGCKIKSIYCGTVDAIDRIKFDLVIANLTLDVIAGLINKLFDITGKYLVLSGVLAEQENDLMKYLSKYEYSTLQIFRKQEWIATRIGI